MAHFSFFFRRLWVKDPRRFSEYKIAKKCYLYRSTRLSAKTIVVHHTILADARAIVGVALLWLRRFLEHEAP